LCLAFYTATSFSRNSYFMLLTRLSLATFEFGRIPFNVSSEAQQRMYNLPFFSRIAEYLSLIRFAFKLTARPYAIHTELSQADHLRTLLALKFISSRSGSSLFVIVCLFPYIILIAVVIAAVPPFRDGCTGCVPDNHVVNFTIAVLAAALLVNALFFICMTKTLPDVWQVFWESRLSSRGVIPAFTGTFIIAFTTLEFKYYFNVLCTIGHCWGYFVVTVYQVYAAWRAETSVQRQINPGERSPVSSMKRFRGAGSIVGSRTESSSLTGETLGGLNPVSDLKGFPRLQEVFSSAELLRAFEYHLSIEFGSENLSFLRDVAEWRATYRDVAKNASAARAKKLINSYIADSGLYQINISYEMAQKLLTLYRSISSDASPNTVPEDAFDEARSEVAFLLERGAAARFMKTPEYKRITGGNILVQALA
jgi:hypothetical protein